MKNYITALMLGLSCSTLYAQEFQAGLGDLNSQNLHQSVQLPDKSILSCGTTSGYGNAGGSCLVSRSNVIGDLLWQRVYTSENGYEDLMDVTMSEDGTVFAAGYTLFNNGSDCDITVVSFLPDGSVAFAKSIGEFGYDAAEKIAATPDGGFVLFGYTKSFSPTNTRDCILMKCDASGAIEWTRGLGADTDAYGKSLRVTPEGNILFTFSFIPTSTGSMTSFLGVVSSAGELLHSTHMSGGEDHDFIHGFAPYGDGYLVVGETNNLSLGLMDGFVIMLDVNLNIEWQYQFGAQSFEHVLDVAVTADESIVLSGLSSSYGAGGLDIMLLQFLPDGSIPWINLFGGNDKDVVNSTIITHDDGFLLTGYSRSFTESFSDGILIKTNERGDSPCNRTGSPDFEVYEGAFILEEFASEWYVIEAVAEDWAITSVDTGELAPNTMCSEGMVEDLDESVPDEVTENEVALDVQSQEEAGFDFNAYPNPSEGLVQLVLPRMETSGVLEIYSLTGTLITRKTIPAGFEGNYSLDLSALGNGVYLLHIPMNDTYVSKRLTIQSQFSD
ncbi:MAG: T9SS type A sorting domain-containing protein [Flavobacteriales bacterium]|nr:T9SS type A sorting domain-containing protein [Flavobacteriales bacterium]